MSAIAFPAAGGPDGPGDRPLRGAQPEITWGEIAPVYYTHLPLTAALFLYVFCMSSRQWY